MDTLSIIKLSAAIIVFFVFIISGTIELVKNKNYWLNRMFAMFFYFSAIGLLTYTIYHFITNNIQLVFVISFLTQVILNLSYPALLMVIFILDYSEKVAMRKKYFMIAILYYVIITFGFFIWPPQVDEEMYSQGIVTTHQNPGWAIFVTFARVLVYFFTIFKFYQIGKHAPKETKNQLKKFDLGMINLTLGIIFILLGQESTIFLILGTTTSSLGALLILSGLIKT